MGRQSLQQSATYPFERAFVVVDSSSSVLTWDQDQVEADWQVMSNVAEGFAQEAFEAASFNGIAVLLRDAQATTCFAEFVPRGKYEQMVVAGADLTGVDVAKLRGLAELRRFRE